MDVINKIGAIIVKNRKILVAKKKDKFIIPGGRLEKGEDDIACLRRELLEELNVKLVSQKFFNSFYHDAALDPGMKIMMKVYFVEIEGVPIASSEITEIKYVSSTTSLKMGSIVAEEVIPFLSQEGIIE